MAGRKIGEAFIRVRPDTQGFSAAAQPHMASAGKLGGKVFAGSFLGSLAGNLLSAGLQATFRAVAGFATDAFGEAREAAKIGRLTDAVIKSTGKQAKISAVQVGALADQLSELAGVDDEIVQGGTNMLLTFTKVRNEVGKGNDIFNQAAQVTLDMNAALTNGNVTAESYRGQMLQVGRALNDPIKGMNSLRRAGVTFSDEQKKQIKLFVEQGKITEAQKIILGELRTEFGGAAAASTDAAQKASVAWANFKERIGTLVLPIVGKLATAFTTKVLPVIEQRVIPALMTFGRWVRDVLVPALKDFGAVAKEKLAAVMVAVRDAWARFQPVAQLVANLIKMAAKLIQENLKKAWEDFRPVLTKLTPILKLVGIIIGVFIVANILALIGILTGLAAIIRYVIVPVLKFLITWGSFVATKLLAAFSATVNWFRRTFWPGLKFVFQAVRDFISRKISEIIAVGRRVVAIYTSFRDAFERARAAVVDKVAAIVAFVRGIPGRIRDAIGNLGHLLYNAGRDILQGLIDGITSKFNALRDKLNFVTNLIPDWKGPLTRDRNLLFGSGRAIIDGLGRGITSRVPSIRGMLGDLTGTIGATQLGAPGGWAAAGGLTVNLYNHGVIGSQREVDNWLVKSVDRLRRERRLP